MTDIFSHITQEVEDTYSQERLIKSVETDANMDWQPFFDRARQAMDESVQKEVKRLYALHEIEVMKFNDGKPFKIAGIVKKLALSALAAGSALIALSFILSQLGAFSGEFPLAALGVIYGLFGLPLLALVANYIDTLSQTLSSNRIIKKKMKQSKQQITKASLDIPKAQQLKLITPQPISYGIRAYTSTSTGQMEAVVTKTIPTLSHEASLSAQKGFTQQLAENKQETFRIPLSSKDSSKAVEEFAALMKVVDEMEHLAQNPYKQLLEKHQLLGWQQQVETLGDMAVQSDTIEELIKTNKLIEEELNALAKERERQATA